MNHAGIVVSVVGCVLGAMAAGASAQDWPQWMGADRGAKVTGFEAPDAWPEALTQAWKVTVGDGVSTPALVGDEMYAFGLLEGNEVLFCLDALTGDELWRVEYEEQGADGAARSFAGPRACPTVAEGKVITLGVRGKITCIDIDTGDVVWRKDYPTVPRFYTSSSPIIANGMCIAQVGGEDKGAVIALDLATGDEKWKWEGGGTSYSSPILFSASGPEMVIAETVRSVVGLGAADGTLLWETPFVVRGRGYNAATPILDGNRVILAGSGRGTRTLTVKKDGSNFAAEEVWANEDQSVMYNTPVLKDGMIYGISDRDQLFCIDNDSGKTLWTTPMSGQAAPPPPAEGSRGGRGGRRGGRGGGGGYGSVVDAGSVLLALTPAAHLVVFEAGKEYHELARYKVSESGATYAYPIVSGSRVFVKDKDSVALWTLGGS